MKITRKIRDAIVKRLRSVGEENTMATVDRCAELADTVASLDVEAETLTIGEVTSAAGVAGWESRWRAARKPSGEWHEFTRADRRWLARFEAGFLVETKYAPADLLDGRLLAFDTNKETP